MPQRHLIHLLTILLKRRLPVMLVRFLLSWFTRPNTNCKLAWKVSLSCTFDIKSGVNLWGILSQYFFILYVNEVFEDILKAKLGCSIWWC